jgi:ABC-type transport system involved in cytochrome c biogenesis permease subunit
VDRLSVLCFGGTYGLALACDLARFVVRGSARWYATLALTTLAWVVQTAYLGNLAHQTHQLPVSTVSESLLVLSWVLAAVGLYLIVRSPKPVAVGVFVLPVVLALVVVAGVWAPKENWAESGWGGASLFWGRAHGLLYLVGAVASCVAFAAGLMYLAQSHRLKHKRPPRFGFALPSLEQSERLNRGAITVAFPFLTAGLLVGVVMLRQAGQSQLSWNDPKVVSGLLVWLVFAGLLHARFRPEMRGRRVMLFTIVAFLCLAFATIGVDLMRITSHGRKRTQDSGLRTQDSGLRLVGQGKLQDGRMSYDYLRLRQLCLPSPPGRGAGGEGRRRALEIQACLDREPMVVPRPSPQPSPRGRGSQKDRLCCGTGPRVLSPKSSVLSPLPARRDS